MDLTNSKKLAILIPTLRAGPRVFFEGDKVCFDEDTR